MNRTLKALIKSVVFSFASAGLYLWFMAVVPMGLVGTLVVSASLLVFVIVGSAVIGLRS